MFSNGIKSANQIQVQTEDGVPVVPVAGDDGALKVEVVSGGASGVTTTLYSNLVTAGAEAESIAVNKKVTAIMVANYSETADVTVALAGKTFVVGSGIATTFAINKQVTNVEVTATEEGTKAQVIIEGVE